MMLLAATAVRAQITIGGNVYGGGNAGDTDGNTNVTIRQGDLNRVYGGARMADVKGRAFTNIDGKNASSYIVINRLYGGNDISGTIGTSNDASNDELPEVIESHVTNTIVDKTWNALLLISTKTNEDGTEATDAQKIYIGQLFGGGDGEYIYGSKQVTTGEGDEAVTKTVYYAKEDGVEVATSSHELTPPVLGKTFLDIHGGSIVYAYGGGNNATVTEKTVISLDNPSKVVNHILVNDRGEEADANGYVTFETTGSFEGYHDLLTNDRFERLMGINTSFSYPSSDEFQIGRLFGGNNKAEMAIRPRWNLQQGKVRNLYSGGNKGNMTSPEGLLLQVEGAGMVVDNVYGGCRMADVTPKKNGVEQEAEPITEDDFGNTLHIPGGMSARTRIMGGHVNNVYGGNDITGRVKGGNSIGVYSTVYGDIYGGGNGSYPYTDNPVLANDPTYGDLYYTTPADADGKTSVEDLNKYRPDAEQVSIYVSGTETKKTIVHGGIYLGGNSASLSSARENPKVELKIGNYVIADKVFLGNNGEHMVETHVKDATHHNEGVLRTYKKTLAEIDPVKYAGNTSKFSRMDLHDATTFATYMEAVAMTLMPSVVFAKESNGDPEDYIDYSSSFGSFYCGGNVGSMKIPGKTTINFNHKVIIYNKLVGGCNNADIYDRVDDDDLNAEYLGGYIDDADADGNKLQLNLSGLIIQPMRWKKKIGDYVPTLSDGEDWDTDTDYTDYVVDANGNHLLEWNTVSAKTGYEVAPVTTMKAFDASTDLDRRLKGGNVYGGCYQTGIVNGNVIININETLMERDKLFDEASDEGDCLYVNTERGTYTITKRNTGVLLSEQGMDVLGSALNVFGGGFGEESEIWGSTTINLNKGYVFQIFGGGEAGAVGNGANYNSETGKIEYAYNADYSTYINLNGATSGVARGATGDSGDMAECEFIYGGGFEGIIAGNTHIRLGNGRIFNSFAGSCNADILGHTETFVGEWTEGNTTKTGFPWIRDHIYGGNDLGGSILATDSPNFSDRIRGDVQTMVTEHHPVSSYMEYNQGRVRNILGGCFGDYDYENDLAYKVGTSADCRVASKPYLHNAFVNIRPNTNANNSIERVFGAGEGFSGDRDGDKLQDHSYVLIDIPSGIDNFANTEIFGAGAYNGLGMRYSAAETFDESFNINEASAVIDLLRGRVGAAYGGSLDEGITRRTMVNVPENSTIIINNIFGGAYGNHILPPCDVYEANVNYRSADARLNGKIYGGNNNVRRTIYAKVNINVPVLAENGNLGTVYGAGKGMETWSEYTQVNLEEDAKVWEVYGGGEMGNVLNAESVEKYMMAYANKPAGKLLEEDDTEWSNADRWVNGVVDDTGTLTPEYQMKWRNAWKAAWTIGDYYNADDPDKTDDSDNSFTGYAINQYTNLTNPLARTAEMDDRTDRPTKIFKYNTNVIIHSGATVSNYVYGGGYGDTAFPMSGGVYGTTYVALLGGTVNKDIYAAGTAGNVADLFGVGPYNSESNPTGFTASANAYIAGGTLRNVFGGGWKGDVGYTEMTVSADESTATLGNERPGETHVVIGIREDQASKPDNYGFYNGVPAIQRNAYGGGEGGAIFGTTHLTLNNGYIGYVHLLDNQIQNEQGKIVTSTESNLEERYEAKVNDETYFVNEVWAGEGRLRDSGNAFGGGYDVRSSVDFSNVTMYGGTIRNSLVGGGEIATIGRGAIKASGPSNSIRTLKGIYKAGKTNVELFNGHVLRNVFGGGKGYNLFGYGQQGTLYMDGYVFGQTEVHVHGGEVGTDEGLAEGYGNVFGGGDIGYVYSPSINSPRTKAKESTGSPGHIYYYNNEGNLSEDCKVVISPYLQVKSGTVEYDNKTYRPYDYVPTDYLNTLPKKNAAGQYVGGWENLFTGDTEGEKERGVHIHNAVFGGGNVSSNSDQVYADATTIYGNTTATLYDVYHRDFITVGTEHTGGIYGGGNLSVVDGYRELNITNYGTDYYGLKQTISIDEYRGLSNRERAYFQLEYKCKATVTIGGVEYEEGKRLTEEEYLKLLENETIAEQVKASFEPYGFCSIYAGRLLNTIQRADFCGVYGSRMVLQGAKDRVAEVGEAIDYTINRVGELSLNRQHTVRSGDTGVDAEHGNYFGIYSLVNYLGNLTSDVSLGSAYVNGNGETETGKTYYSYKSANPTSSDRNKGQSFNQVALASGVFLELTTENSTADHKDYGYVTGVIELDLINVKKDMVGGGFVYAKNEHRVPKYYPNKSNVILSEYNYPKADGGKQPAEAQTYRRYYYTNDNLPTGDEAEGAYVISGDESHVFQTMVWQTSGNFIHPSKRIVDDCYPTNNAYIIGSANYSEAHYWYVKGEVYIYDQKVSAYTGSANAYSKEVHLPLTITAASNGKLQLLNVKPNLYAYKTDNNGTPVKIGTIGSDGKPIDKVFVNNESDSYGLNDVISWWDWHQLSPNDRQYFVTATYVNCVAVSVDGVEYEQGTYVMDQDDYDLFMANTHDIRDAKGELFKDDQGNDIGKTFVFRSSNNISHETGYVLTFDMNSPKVWDDYYSPVTGSSVEDKIKKADYVAKFTEGMTDAEKQAIIDAWREGPTFTPTETGVYGKRTYKAGEVITEATYTNAGEGQDKMEKAYVATETVTYTYNGVTKTVNPGTAISKTEYTNIGSNKNSFAEAFLVQNSVKLTNENFLLYGELKTAAEIEAAKAIEGKLASDQDIDAALTPAYICTADGEYGGQRFETGSNYSAIQAWCSLSVEDRKKFNYNFDALDLLTKSDYLNVNMSVTTSPAPAETVAAFHSPYTDQVDVEYQAVFKKEDVDVEFNGSNLSDGAILTNQEFESIRNDKRHYTRIETKNNGDEVYIAMNNFIYLGTPYGRGQVVDADVFNANSSDVEAVTVQSAGEWYYCYENYVDKNGSSVDKGTLITKAEYGNVPNYQQYFVIQGQEPTETTTLYVSRESNAYDVMSEKIITVVYQYTYYEDEDDGSVKLTNELHVINIHLDLESGVPQIGHLAPPQTVLPGNVVGLKAPNVNPGLYEVLTNGWELYGSPDDADNHRNGVPFENNNTRVYWYQNQKNFIAFYSKTYLGKTYSNPVPLSVANYHDLDAVMKDKEHHMYVDNTNVDRASKIYLDNRECESDPDKSELDLLKDFFDLSLQTQKATSGETKDHNTLDNHVHAGRNLEFIVNSDLSPKKYTTWTPIGNDNTTGTNGQCFEGTLHGDGHTISGLSNSLFGHLCGEVYNLGVTGSFTGAGIAETGDGYIENSWVKSSATSGFNTTSAVFGNPTRTESDKRGLVQIENCYYPESNPYAVPSSNTHGVARQMPDKAFYNGEVAYNLNGFYLHKRYYQGSNLETGTAYQYLQPNADGTLPDNMTTGYYPNDYAIFQPDVKVAAGESLPYLSYVENRFYDGDYRYASGTINEASDLRMRTVTTTVGTGDEAVEKTDIYYVPIWPDDYIFFGQALTYGHVDGIAHQELPSPINKVSNRIQTGAGGNRVYRAPAYFGNKTMRDAYFNPYAIFAQTKKDDASVKAYQGMTAIDFTGGNGDLAGGYKKGLTGEASVHFYPPLLDDDGLTGFRNVDLTQNLLAYAPEAASESGYANQSTHNVLDSYFADLACNELGDDANTGIDETDYRRIAKVTAAQEQLVKGHVVFQTGNAYFADRDHFLVDRQDFNAPISYTFGSEKRMWYQRKPDNYVDRTKGWEDISIPFSAELVTTQQKGEITHFYSGSENSYNDTNTKRGHEYWLREFKGMQKDGSNLVQAKDAEGQPIANVYLANFNYPAAITSDNGKSYTNTFLWDYYYQYSSDPRQDKNKDTYQQDYYKESHTYADYGYSAAATPYIIGFPGTTYYEFDLSGGFKALNTYQPIDQLDAQVITFASPEGTTITISDDEIAAAIAANKADGYAFTPNYLGKPMAEGYYQLNGEGSSYEKVTASGTPAVYPNAVPFRPYFTYTSNSRARSAEKIIFGQADTSFGAEEYGDPRDGLNGTLLIYAKKGKIIVESSLNHTVDVGIFTPAGLMMYTLTVKAGETVEQKVNTSGIYIVQPSDRQYTKKLMVKK